MRPVRIRVLALRRSSPSPYSNRILCISAAVLLPAAHVPSQLSRTAQLRTRGLCLPPVLTNSLYWQRLRPRSWSD